MSEQIWVHKLDENGAEIWTYPAHTIRRTGTYIRLEARFDQDEIAVGPLLLRRDDRFIETFYFHRWYNIFEVFDHESAVFKGWYCNITRPAWIEGRDLFAEDLALDIVVTPDGGHEVLDEQEFQALEISQEDRVRAIQALHELKSQAIAQTGMFALPTSLE